MARSRCDVSRRRLVTIALAVLACSGIACGAILGLEDAPPLLDAKADSGPGKVPDPYAEGGFNVLKDGALDASILPVLDPTFGDGGVVIIDSHPVMPPSVVLDDGDIFLISAHSWGTRVVRYSKNGTFEPLGSADIPLDVGTGYMVNALGFRPADKSGIVVLSVGVRAPHDCISADLGRDDIIIDLSRVNRKGHIERLWQSVLRCVVSSGNAVLAERPNGGVEVIDSFLSYYESSASADDAGLLHLRAFLRDGGPDLAFGLGGYTSVGTRLKGARPQAGIVQEDGKLIVVGSGFEPVRGFPLFLCIGVNTDGGVDPPFCNIRIADPIPTIFNEIAVDDAGYVVSGRSSVGGLLVRLTKDGHLDPSYLDDGLYRFLPGRSHDDPHIEILEHVAFQSDGKLVAFGFVNTVAWSSVLARVGPNGRDPTFGEDGIFPLNGDAWFGPRSFAIWGGTLIMAWSQNEKVTLVRYVVQ